MQLICTTKHTENWLKNLYGLSAIQVDQDNYYKVMLNTYTVEDPGLFQSIVK